MFDYMLEGYRRTPDASCSPTAGCRCSRFGALFVATGLLFTYMPKGFLPSDDVGQLFVFTEAAQDISFDAMSKLQRQVAEIVRAQPACRERHVVRRRRRLGVVAQQRHGCSSP